MVSCIFYILLDKDTRGKYRSNEIFVIYPKCSSTQQKKIEGLTDSSIDFLNSSLEYVNKENAENQKLYERMMGKPLQFNVEIELVHELTRKFLSVSTRRCGHLSSDSSYYYSTTAYEYISYAHIVIYIYIYLQGYKIECYIYLCRTTLSPFSSKYSIFALKQPTSLNDEQNKTGTIQYGEEIYFTYSSSNDSLYISAVKLDRYLLFLGNLRSPMMY